MPGLSSVHLFDKYDLTINGSPIKKVFSDALKAAVDEPEFSIDWSKHKDICGTISLKPKNIEEIDHIVAGLTLDNYINDQHNILVSEIAKEINKYFEDKVGTYCKLHNIDLLEWSRNGQVKYWKNRTEYSYKGEIVCGVEVIQDELIPEDFKLKKTLLLKYY